MGVRYLFSKIAKFLDVQITQQNHGNTLLEMSKHGRFFHPFASWIILMKVEFSFVSTVFCHGPNFQTSCANLHWKRMWAIDSDSPHLKQFVLTRTPLDCRFKPVGSVLVATFQRKNFIFGRRGGFQIYFSSLGSPLIVIEVLSLVCYSTELRSSMTSPYSCMTSVVARCRSR